jgi:DNA-binding NarL/FixJ family response regulator
LLRDASAATLVECVKSVREGRPWLDPDLLHHLARPEPTIAITDNLTSRERWIMHLVALGMPNKEIARQATLSEGTVKMHVHHILVKLRLANRTQLATFAHSRSQQPSHSRPGSTVKLSSLLSSSARSFQQAPATSRAMSTTDRRGR